MPNKFEIILFLTVRPTSNGAAVLHDRPVWKACILPQGDFRQKNWVLRHVNIKFLTIVRRNKAEPLN